MKKGIDLLQQLVHESNELECSVVACATLMVKDHQSTNYWDQYWMDRIHLMVNRLEEVNQEKLALCHEMLGVK